MATSFDIVLESDGTSLIVQEVDGTSSIIQEEMALTINDATHAHLAESGSLIIRAVGKIWLFISGKAPSITTAEKKPYMSTRGKKPYITEAE